MSGLTDARPATGDDRRARHREKLRQGGVIVPAYATAGRHLIALTTPALLVFVPLGLIAAVALFLVVDRSAVLVVNGGFELAGPPGTPVLAWSVAVLVTSVAGEMVVLPATVVLAAGRLTGEDVSVRGALRVAARRWPAMAALVLTGVAVVAAIVAIGFAVLEWTGALALAFAVMTFLALFAMPCLLAVAGVVLEGRSALGALGRAYGLAADVPWFAAFTLAFGVVLLPALVTLAVGETMSGTPAARAAAGSALALVIVPFQAAVIACLFLGRLVVTGRIADFERIADGLPGPAARPPRPVRVLAGILLPGLVYGAAGLVNPLSWPEVAETVVTVSRPRDPGPDGRGRSRPELDWSDLRALHAGQGGRMVMLMDGSAEAKVLTCADSTCSDARLDWAEPPTVHGEHEAVGARLTDGRLAVTTWAIDDHYQWVRDEDWSARLGLLLCDATGCVPAPGGEPLAEVTSEGLNRVVALAARPGGGLLVAQLHGLPPERRDADAEVLSLTFCDDPACVRPRAKNVAKVPVNTDTGGGRDLIAAVAPDDRPVVLRLDRDSGAVFVVSCDDPGCARTRMEQAVEAEPRFPGRRTRPRAALAVRADGRPLIAYRDPREGTIKLIDCRTRTCAQSDTVPLTEPGHPHSEPVMVLDRSGRALVAYQDLGRDRIILATCTKTAGAAGMRCARTPVTRIRHGGDRGLTMALDGHDRPVLAWVDFADEDDWRLVVTRPLHPR